MKKIMKKIAAMTGALLLGTVALAGIPGLTARADEVMIQKPNLVVYEGDVLKDASGIIYAKPEKAQRVLEIAMQGDGGSMEEMAECLLHGSINSDYIYYKSKQDYTVITPEEGYTGYIVRIVMDATEPIFTFWSPTRRERQLIPMWNLPG